MSRVLVVDDEYAVRYLLAATLRDWGYQATVAESGPAAIKALETEAFELVLTDIRMPGMSGLELGRWIRSHYPQLVFIVMTGYGSVDSAAEAVRLGAFDYLLKPFGEMDLVRASVDRAMQRLRLAAELDRSQEAERKLQEAHHKLKEADQLKRQFLAMVTHDLHTPIHIVLGALQHVLDSPAGQLQPEQRRALELARRSAERQSRLVDDLLLLSRLDEGATRAPASPADLCAIVGQAVEEIEMMSGCHGLRLELDLPKEPLMVVGEADRLVQLVTNLLSNALRFASSTVWIRVASESGNARIEVSDDGPGIPPAERERIFDRFVRLQTGRGGAGAGLGLAIVRAIMQSHGGEVHAEDHLKPDGTCGGARFVAALPILSPVAS